MRGLHFPLPLRRRFGRRLPLIVGRLVVAFPADAGSDNLLIVSAQQPIRDATQRFSDRVEDYVRFRPTYPAAVVECLRGEFGLRAEHVVADVGSGTGIWSELLLRGGNAVIGVEPNGPMRAAAERMLAGQPRFRSVGGTAEATTLADASVDWVTAAQAFHWFNVDRTRSEFRRVLRPPAPVALLWNDRCTNTPFLAAFEEFLESWGNDYAAVRHQNIAAEGVLDQFFEQRPIARRTFPNEQSLDFTGLRGRVLSASYMPAAGHPQHGPMLVALQALFDRFAIQGVVVLTYETRLFVGTLS